MNGHLAGKRLIFVTGKGGVGKTAMTEVMARALVKAGQRVLAVEMGSGSALARRFGFAEATYAPQLVEEHLATARLTPGECLREYGLMKLKFRRFYEAVFENPFVRSLVNMTPGMEELLLLGKLGHVVLAMERASAKAPYDTVLVDAPPTGQGTGLLSLPTIILGAVSVGPLARETRYLQALLSDASRTAICVVTTPEELAVDEALEQVEELQGRGKLPVAAVLANRVLPRPERPTDRTILETFVDARTNAGQLDSDAALALTALNLLEMGQDQATQLERLRNGLAVPIVEVPLLAHAGSEAGDSQLLATLHPLLFEDVQ